MKVSSLKFKTFVAAQEARPSPPLGPLLGQYGLNILQFCDDLNQQTLSYQKGTILPISVVKSPIFPKGYRITFKPPTISFLFSSLFFGEEGDFSSISASFLVLDLFDLARAYSFFHALPLRQGSKMVFSFLGSISGRSRIVY